MAIRYLTSGENITAEILNRPLQDIFSNTNVFTTTQTVRHSSASSKMIDLRNATDGWTWINMSAGSDADSGPNACHIAWKNLAENGENGVNIPGPSLHIRAGGQPTQFFVNSNEVGTTKPLKVNASIEDALTISKTVNSGGVGISFTDNYPNPSQFGTIKYYHTDTESFGSTSAFVYSSNQPSTSHLFELGTNNNGLQVKSSGNTYPVYHQNNLPGASITWSAKQVFASGANEYSGHHYFISHDANGNHYPHYRSGSNNNGAVVNMRIYKDASSYRLLTINGNSGEMNWDGYIKTTGTISNPSIWINDGQDYNNFNENIRLHYTTNNAAVIALGATGSAGVPDCAVLGYPDRYEIRRGIDWKHRVYDNETQINHNLRVNKISTLSSQELVLNAGESSAYATGQTNEYVYINAETGLEINASPDNWGSGWAGRVTHTIDANGATFAKKVETEKVVVDNPSATGKWTIEQNTTTGDLEFIFA